MGQVIAFPQQGRARESGPLGRTPSNPSPQGEWLPAALKVVCQLGYLLGFFLVIPGTALMAMKYVAVTQPVGIVACLGLMVVAARLTYAAHRRI